MSITAFNKASQTLRLPEDERDGLYHQICEQVLPFVIKQIENFRISQGRLPNKNGNSDPLDRIYYHMIQGMVIGACSGYGNTDTSESRQAAESFAYVATDLIWEKAIQAVALLPIPPALKPAR